MTGVQTCALPICTLLKSEYMDVVEAMEKLGFRNGWLQDMDSYINYKPDFKREHPFE